MKVLMIVFVVAAMVGAVIVGCGPQQAYCPTQMSGRCNEADTGVAPPGMGGSSGDATIITGTD